MLADSLRWRSSNAQGQNMSNATQHRATDIQARAADWVNQRFRHLEPRQSIGSRRLARKIPRACGGLLAPRRCLGTHATPCCVAPLHPKERARKPGVTSCASPRPSLSWRAGRVLRSISPRRTSPTSASSPLMWARAKPSNLRTVPRSNSTPTACCASPPGSSPRMAWLDKGEAYFRIQHDSAHPFVVMAAGRRVMDLGHRISSFKAETASSRSGASRRPRAIGSRLTSRAGEPAVLYARRCRHRDERPQSTSTAKNRQESRRVRSSLAPGRSRLQIHHAR